MRFYQNNTKQSARPWSLYNICFCAQQIANFRIRLCLPSDRFDSYGILHMLMLYVSISFECTDTSLFHSLHNRVRVYLQLAHVRVRKTAQCIWDVLRKSVIISAYSRFSVVTYVRSI